MPVTVPETTKGLAQGLGGVDPEGALDLERARAADRAGVEVQGGPRGHVEGARGQLDGAGVVDDQVPPLRAAVPVEPGLTTSVPALAKNALAVGAVDLEAASMVMVPLLVTVTPGAMLRGRWRQRRRAVVDNGAAVDVEVGADPRWRRLRR